MQQQAAYWIMLSAALLAGAVVLVRNRISPNGRRSLGQWIIYRLYRVMRFVWAIVRAVDVGYLEYRRVLRETPLLMENEQAFGKLIASDSQNQQLGRQLAWAPEESGI